MDHSSHQLSNRSKYAAVLLWLMVVGATYFMLRGHLQEEELRHYSQWEQRLFVVAYAQSQQISHFLAMKQQSVSTLADDVSLRLYMSTVDQSEDAQAQQTYLRNYILATARQSGFLPKADASDQIRANIPTQTGAGLAIIDREGNFVVATPSMPNPSQLAVYDELSQTDKASIYGPIKLGQDGISVLFAAPIYPVQGDAGDDDPIGYVVASIEPKDDVFEILDSSETHDSPAYSMLVKPQEDRWINISPLADGKAPLSFVAGDTEKHSPLMARAAATPQTLLQGVNTLQQQSLAYALDVDGTDWMLVREVDHAQAFAALTSRLDWLNLAYWLTVSVVSLLVVAVWRHVSADKLSKLVSQIRAHESLLTLVTDRIPARLFIVNAKHEFRYANKAQAQHVGADAGEMIGNSMPAVMGQHAASSYMESSEKVIRANEAHTKWAENVQEGQIMSASEIQYVPLDNIPSESGHAESGVLVIEHDLTEVMKAKHESQQTLNKLIETLVMLVDTRDPYAARHSAGVALIARAIAEAMQLDKQAIHTVEIAGRLMNIGKLLVPVDILTSEKALDAEEKTQIHQSLQAAIEYLEPISFDGPVVETLKQSHERPDGKGPLSLKEEDILVHALILHVANHFVAITSPRAYRDGKSIDEALKILSQDVGSSYARSVVSGLNHYLDNLGGRSVWSAHLAEISVKH